MWYVSDCDGVLADTRAAVKRAYELAGVEMPDDAWGKPWYLWLADEDAHKRKSAYYERALIAVGECLDGAHHLLRARELGYSVGVLSGASESSVRAVLRLCSIPDVPILGHSEGSMGKAIVLRKLGAGIYVDDMDFNVPPGWKFVKYVPGLETEDVLRWTL